MKQVVVGCASALLGFCIGVTLTFGYFSVGIAQTIETPIPPASPGSVDVTVTASAKYLNSQVQQAARQSGMLKQASVTLDVPNIVRVATVVDVTLLGQRINTNVTVTMRVSVKNNRIVLAVEKVDTGNLPVPPSLIDSNIESVRAQMENQINALAQRGLQGTGLRLSNVRINPGAMIVDLVAQ